MAYIVKQRTRGGKMYVHLAINHHVPKLNQARQTREHLGVLDEQTGELLWNSKRPEPEAELLTLLTKAGITYQGQRAPRAGRKLGIKHRFGQPSAIEDIGEMHVLMHLCQSIGLDKCALEFGEDGPALLALAIWQACAGDPQYLAEFWLETRVLPETLHDVDFSSSAMSALMRRVGCARTLQDRFFRAWIKACGYPDAVIYDTTSLSTYSDRLEDAEWGYNRDHDILPQVNLALAADGRSGLPLAFRLLPGSISDVKTLLTTGEFLTEYGLKKFSYSLDRGFYSNANMRGLLADGLRFVIGVPFSNKQARNLVKNVQHELQSSSRSILYGEQVIRQTQSTWTVDMGTGEKTRQAQAFVFLDQERATGQILGLEKKLLEIERLAGTEAFANRQEAELWRDENAKKLARYFKCNTESPFEIRRNEATIDEACSMAGISLYIAYAGENVALNAEQALTIARGRDAIEKVFDVYKNDNNQNRLRTGDREIAQGRMLLAFLAAIARMALEARLRKAKLNKKFTVDEALAMFRKIKAVKFESGRRILLEIPKKTRELLNALEITSPVIADNG